MYRCESDNIVVVLGDIGGVAKINTRMGATYGPLESDEYGFINNGNKTHLVWILGTFLVYMLDPTGIYRRLHVISIKKMNEGLIKRKIA